MKITPYQIVKNLILVLLLIWVAFLSSGCLVNRPYAKKTITTTTLGTNGVPVTVTVEEVITKSTTLAAGDSKQAVASLAAKSTRTTQSAGAEGIAQEASTAGVQEMFKAMILMGIDIGKKSVVPPVP